MAGKETAMAAQTDSVPPLNFPTEGVLPKEETGAAKFVTENREFFRLSRNHC